VSEDGVYMNLIPKVNRRCNELPNNSYRGSVFLSADSALIQDTPQAKVAMALNEVV
jgi:hypothetical protein